MTAGRFRSTSRGYYVVGVVLVVSVVASYLFGLRLLPGGLLVVLATAVTGIAVVPGAWSTLYRTTGVGAGAWILAIAVGGGGIALSYLIGDPRPFCEGVNHRGCLTPYGWASALYLASSIGIAIAAGHLGRYRLLRSASVEAAGKVEEGTVAVEGRLGSTESPVSGPVSGAETVWYRCVVERALPVQGYLESEGQTAGRDFYVEDGSGRVPVTADRLDEHDVAELARSYTDDEGNRRRREWSYQLDDAVTVVGEASEVSRAEYSEPIVLGLDGPVLVGLEPLGSLRSWAARRAIVGGVTWILVGLPSLLGMLVLA